MISSMFFDRTVKVRNIILKTEQTTITSTQWDRWTSYVIKHIITIKVDYQNSSVGGKRGED